MKPLEANKMKGVTFSPIRGVMSEVAKMQGQGLDVVNLGIGEPDFDTPEHIVEALYAAAKKGATHYTDNRGIPELRQAIAEKVKRERGVEYGLDEIICTVGATEGVFLALVSFLNPGDEVLVPDPTWLNYIQVPAFIEARLVPYPLDEASGFQVDTAALEALVTDRAKAIVIVNPSNPTGGVQTKETLKGIAAIAEKHDLLVVCDEIYEKIVYSAEPHVSAVQVPGLRERTVLINGFSKSFAMTGWRLGWVLAPAQLTSVMVRLHMYTVTHPASMVQWAGVAALTGSQEPVARMVATFRERRDFIYDAVSKMPGVRCAEPQGAFYLFPNIEETGMSEDEFCHYMLKEAMVGVVPGTAFGKNGKGHVRISYATSMENLEKAANRMQAALEKR